MVKTHGFPVDFPLNKSIFPLMNLPVVQIANPDRKETISRAEIGWLIFHSVGDWYSIYSIWLWSTTNQSSYIIINPWKTTQKAKILLSWLTMVTLPCSQLLVVNICIFNIDITKVFIFPHIKFRCIQISYWWPLISHNYFPDIVPHFKKFMFPWILYISPLLFGIFPVYQSIKSMESPWMGLSENRVNKIPYLMLENIIFYQNQVI